MPHNPMTRRDALFVLAAAAAPQARAEGGLLRATRVDHIGLAVGDIDKEMLFYSHLFGAEVLKDSRTPKRYLRLGPCYVAIAPATAGEAKRIDHFSIGIENFNAPEMRALLEKAGFKVSGSDLGGGLFVTDPGGVSIQIWDDQSWRKLIPPYAAPEAGPKMEALFHPRGMHHVAIQSGDQAETKEFYQKLFGEPGLNTSTPPQPSFPAGDTRIILYNPATGKPAKIDHFSVLVDNFEAKSAVKAVKDLGAKAELSKQGTLNEFYDPEGIRLQVTFPGQTYGSPAKK